MGVRIAIDTGGTFTDLVLFDETSGRVHFHKIGSTPDDPGRAIVQGVLEIIGKAGVSKDNLSVLIHGTTVATNTVLQRRGARTTFITTAGFRDVLQIQRQDRPHLYNLRSRRAEPLIPRSRRYELSERIRFDGEIQTPIDHDQLKALINDLSAHDIEAVAVGFLHSHINPLHEVRVGDAIAERYPDLSVCLSHELNQEEGEYERFSACAMNAYVQPVMARYLRRIDETLARADLSAPLFVMKSNGGVMTTNHAARQCIHTILSGPAGGVIAGSAVSDKSGRPNIITADMGGTSFDVSIIHHGAITYSRDSELEGLALRVPMLDIHTVGAGGGSIGWVDAGGALRVGPHSAGADPGPACYSRGGEEPTITDANLVLGRISSASLLGGTMQLDREAARRSIHDRLAKRLNLSIEAAAEGMIHVVNAVMTAAIRKLTVERGYDPRSFSLCAFGGAGPLHAAELSRELGLRDIIIPIAPGVTSAIGLLMSPMREDRVRTKVCNIDDLDATDLSNTLKEMEAQARSQLIRIADTRPVIITRQCGIRYRGQGYDLIVRLNDDQVDLRHIETEFHREHERTYGFSRPDQQVQLVNVWVSVQLDFGVVQLPPIGKLSSPSDPVDIRPVMFSGTYFDTPVYRREGLGGGWSIVGPAIIEQLDSTTAILPGQNAEIDAYGQIIMS